MQEVKGVSFEPLIRRITLFKARSAGFLTISLLMVVELMITFQTVIELRTSAQPSAFETGIKGSEQSMSLKTVSFCCLAFD